MTNPVNTGDTNATSMVSDGTFRYTAMYTEVGEVLVAKQILAGDPNVWASILPITGAARTALALPLVPDTHRYVTIAIAGDGYLFIWANMHQTPLHMIRSSAPNDITAWVSVTLTGADANINTYPIVVHRSDGSLRIVMRSSPGGPGHGDHHYWETGPSDHTWGAKTMLFKGNSVANAKPGGGTGDDGTTDTIYNWSAYPCALPHVQDVGGGHYVEHWAWVWRTGAGNDPSENARSNVALSYVQYRSLTDTWHAADGTAVTLPIDIINDPAVQTGIDDNGEGYLNGGGITCDNQGHPHIIISQGPHYHVWWNGTSWNKDFYTNGILGPAGHMVGRSGAHWFRNSLWFTSATGIGTGLVRCALMKEDGSTNIKLGGPVPDAQDGSDYATANGTDDAHFFPGTWQSLPDPIALRVRGTIEMMIPQGNVPHVTVVPADTYRVNT